MQKLFYFISFIVLLLIQMGCKNSENKNSSEKNKQPAEQVDNSNQITTPTTTIDTASYFDLKLVKLWENYGAASIKFELTNRIEKPVTKFWIYVSLIDKKGEYQGEKMAMHFDNVRVNSKNIQDQRWYSTDNINVKDIKSILIEPDMLEIDGERYKFETHYVKFIDNKLQIALTF